MDDHADTDPVTNGSSDAPDAPPLPDVDEPDVGGLLRADGRRRRRTALLVVAAALAGAAGMWIGSRIQSPADRAAARQAPTPSLVTVPVERRQLTSELALSGEVAYNEPLTVTLAAQSASSPASRQW